MIRGVTLVPSKGSPAFKITFGCGNCGASWSDEYPPRTLVLEDGKVQTHNKDCDKLGTVGCDCCSLVECPTCHLVESVEVADRNPIEEGESDAE